MRKLIVYSAFLCVVIVAAIFILPYVLKSEREIEKLPLRRESNEHIDRFAGTVLPVLMKNNDGNLCVFHLPIIQCMLSSDKHKALRDAFGLPSSRDNRKTLFDDIESLLNNYERNWSHANLESLTFLSKAEALTNDNLFDGSKRTNVRKLDYAAVSEIMREWLIEFPEASDGGDGREEAFAIVAAKFDAFWRENFEGHRDGIFTLVDGSKLQCEFMYRTNEMKYAITDEYAAALLEFKGTGIGMLLLKPNSYDGLNALAGTLITRSVWAILDGLTLGEIYIMLPPLDIKSNVSIEAVVRDSNEGRDISRVDDGVVMERILQTSRMKLDKEGVSIRTVTFHGDRATLTLPSEIRFDSPFLFAIVDTINSVVLFSGVVRNPLSVSSTPDK